MVVETKKDIYHSSPAQLEPELLNEFLPDWKYEEKLFEQSIRRGKVVREYWGWVFESPKEALIMMIKKDQELEFLRSNSLKIKGIETITAQRYDNTNLISFVGGGVTCSLEIDLKRERYQISYRQFLSRKRWTNMNWEIETRPTLLVVEGDHLRVRKVGDTEDYLNRS